MGIFNRLSSRLFESIVVSCLALMLVLVFSNVVLRYGFNSGLSRSDEGARFLFVWLTFIGAVIALRDNAHLGIDLLVRRLPSRGQRICAVLGELLMLFCCVLFLVGSLRQTAINMSNLSPVGGIPLGLMYAAGVIGSLSMAAIILFRLYRLLSGRDVPAHADEALASEVRP
jgi:TRAP-type C4-dicarboxylate transport system permease small subunit